MQLAKEQTENAWNDLTLAKERKKYLQDQVDIAGQFLVIARKERELGRRSLIDVLAGETSLINAKSEHVAAKAERILAGYRVLRSMGKLSLSDIQTLLK